MISSLIIGIILFIIPFICGASIFVSFVLISTILLIYTANLPGMTIALQAVSSVSSFTLVAIPFFILLGNIMIESKSIASLFNLVRAFIGSIKASLGMAVIWASVLFGTMCGSGVATAVAMSSAAGPELIKSGYSRERAAAIAGSAGCLGFMIPPSVVGVILAEITRTSVADLFAAIIGPGLVIALTECVTCYFTCRNIPEIKTEPRHTWKERSHAVLDALPAFLIPAVLFILIYGGIATPTEASGVACVAAALVGFFYYRKLTWANLQRAFNDTVISSGSIFCLVFGALIFGRALAELGIPQFIAAFTLEMGLTQIPFLLSFIVIFLILGCFLDIFALLYICIPPVLPALAALGINPIHFSTVFLVSAFAGQITPPVCITLYAATTPIKANVGKTIRLAMPYLIAVIVANIIVALFPEISLFLVKLSRLL